MTLLSPWGLLLLVVPLALVAAYVLAQRARQKVVVRFTSVDMLASVAPKRPGWQRHLAAAGIVASLAIMAIAFAKPARVTRTPRQRATVVLSLDTSGSMVANDVSPTRLAAAEQAARSFVAGLPKGVQLGLVSFASNARVLVSPTTDRATVLAAIGSLRAGGGTATGDAIDLSLNAIKTLPPTASGKPAPAAIVLMSDGTPTLGRGDQTPAESVALASAAAKAAGVSVSTIAFGTADGVVNVGGRTIAVPSDPGAMAAIAHATGGQTFTASTASQLRSVYRQIGRAVGYDVHRHSVAGWFVGAAFVLVLLGAIAALVWTQRLV